MATNTYKRLDIIIKPKLDRADQVLEQYNSFLNDQDKLKRKSLAELFNTPVDSKWIKKHDYDIKRGSALAAYLVVAFSTLPLLPDAPKPWQGLLWMGTAISSALITNAVAYTIINGWRASKENIAEAVSFKQYKSGNKPSAPNCH